MASTPSVCAPATSEDLLAAHVALVDMPASLSQLAVKEQAPERRRMERTLSIGYRTLTLQDGNKLANRTRLKGVDRDVNADVHTMTPRELELRFGTMIDEGLPECVAARRAEKYGKNLISPPPSQWAEKLFGYFFGGFCWLLWIACILTFLSWRPFGEPDPPLANLALAFVILIVLILQVIFTAYQDFTSSRIMLSINSMIPQIATVIRDSKQQNIPGTHLVPGDIVIITYGSKVPADIRLLEVHGLKLDNSILTGEAIPITATVTATDDNIHETRNIALMGTFATEGYGKGMVVRTADRTMMGCVADMTNTTHIKHTILQKEIQRFVRLIAALAITTAIICFIYWTTYLRVRYPTFLSLSAFLSMNMGIIVAYVPDGLPIAITLVLTIIARRMFSQRILVKSLTTVETLGCVNILCSDKTGTLTTNKMTVNSVAICDELLDAKKSIDHHINHVVLHQIALAVQLCNGASFDLNDYSSPITTRRMNGDATDCALLRFGHSIAHSEIERNIYERIYHIPFNSKTKRMVTVLQVTHTALSLPDSADIIRKTSGMLPNNGQYHPLLFVKGAPDYLLPLCTKYLNLCVNDDGVVMPMEVDLTDNQFKILQQRQEQLSSNGERIILVARRVLDGKTTNATWIHGGLEDDSDIEPFVNDLCVLGLVGIVDPPRPETLETVETMRGAGIRLFMVTGDFSLTAAAIARSVHIFTKSTMHVASHIIQCAAISDFNPNVKPTKIERQKVRDASHNPEVWVDACLLLKGSDLLTFDNRHWNLIAHYPEIVFARTTPEQKLLIVRELQSRGNIVAVTGDGTNDAPALKNSDIGIAMGSGSEVAMEAASMVLLDSNFSSVVTALHQGRTVFENLKKVCLYLLPAGSFSELLPVLCYLFLGVPAPLSSFLMIVICVLTDPLPAMALMYENPEGNLLLKPPRQPGVDSMVDRRLILHAYLFIGSLEAFFAHVMYFVFMRRNYGVRPSSLLFAFDKWGIEGYAGLTANQQSEANKKGQCVFFVTLVVMQFGNLLATRTRRFSIFQHTPIRNPRLFYSMFTSFSIAVLFVYVPYFQDTFHTSSIPAEYWFIPFLMAFIILILDEIRKYCVRTYPKSLLAKLAW